MSVDLNDRTSLPLPRPTYDLDTLSAALAERAADWLPRLFPRGRIEDGDLRLANIQGDAPGKSGSCVIHLRGDEAGSWYDHSDRQGGKPLSTLGFATGLSGQALLEYAAELIGGASGAQKTLPARAASKANGHTANGHAPSKADEHVLKAATIWQRASPAPGTLAEAYLAARGLRLPATDELRYAASLANEKREPSLGRPALLARFRDASTGEPTGGIHRIYLREDGSGHIGAPHAKLSLGPSSGVVILGQPDEQGRLAIGEGIESTLAADQIFGTEGHCWATCSTSGMKHVADAFRAKSAESFTARVSLLVVFADKGRDGEARASELVQAARSVGIEAQALLPKGGDDFADDLVRGLWDERSEESSALCEIAAPVVGAAGQPTREGAATILALVDQLTFGAPPSQLAEVMRQFAAANAGLSPIERQRVIDTLAKKAGISKRVIEAQLRSDRSALSQNAPHWAAKIVRTDIGDPVPIAANIVIALREDAAWVGTLALDEFRQQPMMMRRPPWPIPADESEGSYPRPITDVDENRILVWVQEQGIHVRIEPIRQALSLVTNDNKFHPVRDYLNSLVWDRQPRLDRWLSYYLGAEDIPNYTSPIGVCWLISAVARIFEPGCQAKYVLILEGEQDIYKSSALEVLGSPWFTDDIDEMGSQNSKMQVNNAWIVELPELDSTRRAHVNAVKAFIARKADRFRLPYGRNIVEQPRTCVLAGSVNPSLPYFSDETGATRFWPIKCERIDIEALRADRDQIWAEAVHRYRAGERWHLVDEDQIAEARREQDARQASDSWEDQIEAWLKKNQIAVISIAEILHVVFEIPSKDHDTPSQMRVGRCLHRLGWRKSTKDRARPRPYYAPPG